MRPLRSHAGIGSSSNNVAMEMRWCWRCKMDVPMLNEAEYAQMAKLYSESMRGTKSHTRRALAFAGYDSHARTIRTSAQPVRRIDGDEGLS